MSLHRRWLLAEKCGVAFQLTNIIRDVKEDQEKGRIYLPKEDRDKLSGSEGASGVRGFKSAAVLCRVTAADRDMVHPRQQTFSCGR